MVAFSDDVAFEPQPTFPKPARPDPSRAASAIGHPSADMAFWSAAQLARAIKEKKISALELLDAYLARIEKFNDRVNAIVDVDIAGARSHARAADEALMRGDSLGPLHGVPFTVKDSVDVAGLASTWGIREFKDNRPARSAPMVEALTAAGAIAFGKTNVPLALLSWETFNDLYGTTNNPWDLSRSPGGSSGGSAAALAAGLTALEVGSDSAGSLRGPAHACGVYTHRPTFGLISVEGQELPGIGPSPDIMVMGPMARSAEDLVIALNVMARPDEVDAPAWRLSLPPARHTRLSDFRVAVMLEHQGQEVDRAMQDRLAELVEFLARQGAKVSMTARPEIDFDAAHRLFLSLAGASAAGAIPQEIWERLAGMAEVLRKKKRRNAELEAAVTGYVHSHREWIRLDLVRNHLRSAWSSFFRDYDLLLSPVAATAAQPHDQSSRIDRFRKIVVNGKRVAASDQWFWAGLPAVAYLSSTVAPAGLVSPGLPIGVQIIGPQYGDHTCLAFARLLEQEYRSFVPPPGWE
jgi:amidase